MTLTWSRQQGFILFPDAEVPTSVKVTFLGRFIIGGAHSAFKVSLGPDEQVEEVGRRPLGAFGPQGSGTGQAWSCCDECHTCFLGERGTSAALAPVGLLFTDPGAQELPVRSPPIKSRTLEQAHTWQVSP